MQNHKNNTLNQFDNTEISLNQESSPFLDLSSLLSSSTPLGLNKILDIINEFGKVGGLTEDELNSFRQQVLSLGIDDSSPHDQNDSNTITHDPKQIPRVLGKPKNINQSKRSGVFNRRGIGTIDGMP